MLSARRCHLKALNDVSQRAYYNATTKRPSARLNAIVHDAEASGSLPLDDGWKGDGMRSSHILRRSCPL